jgi:hypothetical protein
MDRYFVKEQRMSAFQKNLSAMEPSSTAAMMRMSKVALVLLATSPVQTPTSAFLTPGFVTATVIVPEEKMRLASVHLVKGLNATTEAASHRAGYVMEI